MKYLPILDELFSSDSIFILLISLVVAIVIGLIMQGTRKNLIAVISCVVVYIACELVSNMHIGSSFLLDIVCLFIGTIAIGGILGFLVTFILHKTKNR